MNSDTTAIELIELTDIDALIEDLEAQFEDSQFLPTMVEPTTSGCTNVAGCVTGTCPCS